MMDMSNLEKIVLCAVLGFGLQVSLILVACFLSCFITKRQRNHDAESPQQMQKLQNVNENQISATIVNEML